jgi:hypothetical protein
MPKPPSFNKYIPTDLHETEDDRKMTIQEHKKGTKGCAED